MGTTSGRNDEEMNLIKIMQSNRFLIIMHEKLETVNSRKPRLTVWNFDFFLATIYFKFGTRETLGSLFTNAAKIE